MIKITILQSILNGELMPWVNCNNQFNESIESLYLEATSFTPVTTPELQQQLALLLSPFPSLSKFLQEQYLDETVAIIPSFYLINIPQHTTSFTAFYYLLVKQETARIFNQVLIKCAGFDGEMRTYIVTSVLKELKYLALQITDEIRERGFADLPDASIAPIHYVLFTARYLIIHLFFSLQEIYGDVIQVPVIPKAFFQTFLKEPFKATYLLPSSTFYENKLMFYIDNNLLTPQSINPIFDELKNSGIRNKGSLVAKYENAIYLVQKGQNPIEVKNLLNSSLITELVAGEKKEIQSKLSAYHLGLERLEIVHEELTKLHFADTTSNNVESVPSQLRQWLLLQDRIYSSSASQVFNTSDTQPNSHSPKQIIKKANVQEFQQIALQHLLFMKGVNGQNEIIMSDTQFEQMIKAVNVLIETELVPQIDSPLQQINLPNNYIRYTFYRLHKALYTTKSIKDCWINFLHDMFTQFTNADRKTTRQKFSEKPPMYDTDLKRVTK